MTYYELLEDNTIGRSTTSEKVAQDLGLSLTTDKEIVYAWDGKRYFADEVPEAPTSVQNEKIRAERQARYEKESDPLRLYYDEALARGEDTAEQLKQEWLSSKDRIREELPYVEGADATEEG